MNKKELQQLVNLLGDALDLLYNDYKCLADSGDAGCWNLEDTKPGQIALIALTAYENSKKPNK